MRKRLTRQKKTISFLEKGSMKFKELMRRFFKKMA